MNDRTIRLSPITRLTMTLSHEMDADCNGAIFNDERFQKYLGMYSIAVRRRDNMLKSLVLLDGITLILLFGKTLTIPGIGLNLAEIPAALEMVTTTGAICFLFLSMAFVNEQTYVAILNRFNNRRALASAVDPDFVAASESYFEFVIKLYRKKFNIFGFDFYEPGSGYRWFFGSLYAALNLILIVILLFHLLTVAIAIKTMVAVSTQAVLSYTAISIILLATICGLLMSGTMLKSFDFTISDSPYPDKSATP
jgi:hypothetical protein